MYTKIEKEKAFELLNQGFKAKCIDNEYNCCDYYGIIQAIIVFNESEVPTDESIVEFYTNETKKDCSETTPHSFENENNISCDNDWYYLYAL